MRSLALIKTPSFFRISRGVERKDEETREKGGRTSHSLGGKISPTDPILGNSTGDVKKSNFDSLLGLSDT